MLRFLLLLLVGWLAWSPSYAQSERTINGIVKDEFGTGLPGAHIVLLEGTKTNAQYGTPTDINGKFSLKLPSSAKAIKVSYIGYEDRTITLDERTTYEISLTPSSESLEEVRHGCFHTQGKHVYRSCHDGEGRRTDARGQPERAPEPGHD